MLQSTHHGSGNMLEPADCGMYKALLLGNAIFGNETLSSPGVPRSSLVALSQTLCDSRTGLFSMEHTDVRLEASSYELRRIVREFFEQSTENDVLFFCYAGHLRRDGKGNIYLCASDTRSDLLPGTALSLHGLSSALASSAAKAVALCFDCSTSSPSRPSSPFEEKADFCTALRQLTQTRDAVSLLGAVWENVAALPPATYLTDPAGSVSSAEFSRPLRDSSRDGLSPFLSGLTEGLREDVFGKRGKYTYFRDIGARMRSYQRENQPFVLLSEPDGNLPIARRLSSLPGASHAGLSPPSSEPALFESGREMPTQVGNAREAKFGRHEGTAEVSEVPLHKDTVLQSNVPDVQNRYVSPGQGASSIGATSDLLIGHTGEICTLVSGRVQGKPVVISGGRDGKIRMWDPATTECLQMYTGHTGRVECLVLGDLAGKSLLISGGRDGKIRVWDARTGKCSCVLRAHAGGVRALLLGEAKDKFFLFSAGADRKLRVWSLPEAELLSELTGHTGAVHTLAFVEVRGNMVLVSAGEDGTVRIWDRETVTP